MSLQQQQQCLACLALKLFNLTLLLSSRNIFNMNPTHKYLLFLNFLKSTLKSTHSLVGFVLYSFC